MDESLVKIRHERSKKDYPKLRLAEDEYVEFVFKRAKICLFLIMGGTAISVILVLIAFLMFLLSQAVIDEMGQRFLFIMLGALLVSAIIIGTIAFMIYNGNKLFVTNKHVVQLVMSSLVSSSENMIDLPSIEDVSFRQEGIMQQMFHYGTLRLATVGDETTYTFKYSDISSEELKAVSKLVTEAKKTCKKKDN
ncbi:hypothetical protein IKF28_02585 [Candidatus Saccharibacteria bacterium]|nr:hypothetical protein [Candidatus Saccharibacteria bacterium]